jgi:hypothetical protein
MHTTKFYHFKMGQWLTALILAIREAEIRRIQVQGQPRQIVFETHLPNNQVWLKW